MPAVYFSWRQEKYQKNHAAGVATLAQMLFRRGQELVRLRRFCRGNPLWLPLSRAAVGRQDTSCFYYWFLVKP